MATEFAIALSLSGTELSKIPVKFGIMKPPKNRTSHKKIMVSTKLFTKGTGKVAKQAKQATKKHTVKARLLVYPPIYVVVTNPPTRTPTVGPVIDAPE